MNKIKVGFYVHNWDYAGVSQAHLNIIEVIDRTIFEPYAFHWDENEGDNKLSYLRNIIGERNLVPFKRSKEKTGPEQGYTPLWTDFHDKVTDLSIDILHTHRSGYYEWPFNKRIAKLQIENNVFAYKDNSAFLDKSICISKTCRDLRGGCDWLMYSTVRLPSTPKENNLRKELGIPDSALVCGRLGRPGNFSPIAIEAFKKALDIRKDLYYIVVNPCQEVIRAAAGIKNVIFLPSTLDEVYIERFFNSLDLFLHYRFDGEMFGLAIAQAMMFGVPVISHISGICDAHVETIGDCGYVATNVEEYYAYLRKLILCPEIRIILGEKAKAKAIDQFEQKKLVKMLEGKYLEWMGC